VRLGVSAKIFLAYAVILVAFAASSTLSIVYLHRGRQEMAADRHRRAIQSAVEGAGRALAEFSLALPSAISGPPGGLASRARAAHGIPTTRDYLKQGQAEVKSYLAEEAPVGRPRAEFEGYGRDLARLEGRLDELAGAAAHERGPAEDTLPYLIDDFRKLGDGLRAGSLRSAQDIVAVEARALYSALLLGGVGLLFAVGAALFMWRTLRPLHVLRMHARQIAGGDYGRRIVATSHDEIGDLAREFDAMGRAIEERERRLIRSERLATVGRMAAHITHEIRNPLASLGLYVELLGDELGAGDAEARRLVASIGNEIDRLSEITETYLRFVRLPRPDLEREDLGAIATAVMEFARAELSKAGIALELAVAAGLPDVAADENQLRQALLNLVRNAKEAMPSGGILRVEVGAGAGQVRVAVADTGAGIAPDHLGKIFDPFFSTKEKGTGLGLALVQQILAEHGGRVEVASPPGGGTTFSLLLPALGRDAPVVAAVSGAVAPPETDEVVEPLVPPQPSTPAKLH
jgi:two-component system NtrC family sensor kinase